MQHIIEYRPDRVLIDRQTFARLSGRSEETIRRRCTVAEYRNGKALYDMNECAEVLAGIPTRQRAA